MQYSQSRAVHLLTSRLVRLFPLQSSEARAVHPLTSRLVRLFSSQYDAGSHLKNFNHLIDASAGREAGPQDAAVQQESFSVTVHRKAPAQIGAPAQISWLARPTRIVRMGQVVNVQGSFTVFRTGNQHLWLAAGTDIHKPPVSTRRRIKTLSNVGGIVTSPVSTSSDTWCQW